VGTRGAAAAELGHRTRRGGGGGGEGIEVASWLAGRVDRSSNSARLSIFFIEEAVLALQIELGLMDVGMT
jgi:hypothetical protein